MEKRFLDTAASVEYRDADGKKEPAAFVGQAIVTGKRSHPLFAWGTREVREIIDAKALDGADMSDVLASFNHDLGTLLGRSTAGTLSLTRGADGGLSYRVPYDSTDPDHVRVMRKIEKGEVTGSSFMFDLAADDGALLRSEKKEGEKVVVEFRVMKIRKLYELGPVAMPAYPDSKAASRTLYGRSLAELEAEKIPEEKPETPAADGRAEEFRCRARLVGLL